MSQRGKRRSRSSPPESKRTQPGTPGPYTEDLIRANLQANSPGASPTSVKKAPNFRKQLFHMKTRGPEASSLAGMSSPPSDDNPVLERDFQPPEHITLPPVPEDQIEELTREPRQPAVRRPNPPELHDVLTQQTEILAGMMQELRRAQPAQQQDPAETLPDPHFQWDRLCLPSVANFRVPGEGMIQRMATSLFAKLPLLTGRDQHEARFTLQVTSIWPDLSDEDRVWAFQPPNVYCIVAALGWPAATAACASSTATTYFILAPGLVLPQPEQPRLRNRRNNRDQQAARLHQPQHRKQHRSSRRANNVVIDTKTTGAEGQTITLETS